MLPAGVCSALAAHPPRDRAEEYDPWMRDLQGLTAAMHERGLRVTPQRHMIYELLAGSPSHPTVDAVHDAVSKVLPTVSLRTVYQALHDLEELGEIRLAQVGGGALRVDLRTDHHAHIVCAG